VAMYLPAIAEEQTIALDELTPREIVAELDTTRTPERAGRAMDHEAEDAFERLRVAGYL